eukprot:8563237-Pyramimonas_sp.AAC.1
MKECGREWAGMNEQQRQPFKTIAHARGLDMASETVDEAEIFNESDEVADVAAAPVDEWPRYWDSPWDLGERGAPLKRELAEKEWGPTMTDDIHAWKENLGKMVEHENGLIPRTVCYETACRQ